MMKQLLILLFSCCTLFSSKAQNDSIRILVFPFEVSGEVKDKSLATKIPSKLQEELAQDFLFIDKDNVSRFKVEIDDWLYENEPEIKKEDLDVMEVLKLRAPNFYITGTVYQDQITVKLYPNPGNVVILPINKKWNLPESGFPYKPVEEIADLIWKHLKGGYNEEKYRAKLLIRSKYPTALVRIDGNPLEGANNIKEIDVKRASTIKISVGEEERKIELDDYTINQVRIKQKDGKYQIKRPMLSGQFLSALNQSGQDLSLSHDFTLRFLLRKGFSIGALAQYYQLNYRYDYPTLEGLGPIQLEWQSNVFNFALNTTYERYLSPVHLIWQTDAYLIFFPELGGGIRTGVSYEKLPFLQAKLGYQWFNANVEQAKFNPFGNATFEQVEREFGGWYFGLGLQFFL
ncbi:MAG: hypothetical protein AAF806_22085 [Bacteroidota bacterium]